MLGGEVRQLTAGSFGAVSFAPVGDRCAAVLLGGADDDELRLGTR